MAFKYPTRFEFKVRENIFNLTQGQQGDPFGALMPTVTENISVFAYKIKSAYGGLQAARGNEGSAKQIDRVGSTEVTYAPGVYGDYDYLSESELKNRNGDTEEMNQTIRDLYFDSQERLMIREQNRILYSKMRLAVAGLIQVFDKVDSQTLLVKHDFGITTFTAPTVWSNHAASTPIYDILNNIKSRANYKRVNWKDGTIMMTSGTFWHFIQNTNTADLMGGVKAFMGTYAPQDVLNHVATFMRSLNLPAIQIVDNSYFNDSQTETQLLADSEVAIIGKLNEVGNNAPLAYVYTISLTKDNGKGDGNTIRQAGGYTVIVENDVPPFTGRVFRGHDGAPRCEYPDVLAPMSV